MLHFSRLVVSMAVGTAVLAMVGCSHHRHKHDAQAQAQARLEARSGSTVSGLVTLKTVGHSVWIEAHVSGLTPGEHGFHVHEAGDCSAPDAASAKGHFNPDSKGHGHHHGNERHAGDLPNLVADASGHASYKAEVPHLTLGTGNRNIVGRSLVVHADPDDYKSQPAGNSGKRVACGTIVAL
jgi:superoxide dismutase, Cu-Zn family